MRMTLCSALVVTVCTLGVFTGGCSSAPYAKGESASTGLQSLADTLSRADTSLDASIAALNDLSAGQNDLAKRFDRFSKAVDRLASDAKRVRGEADAMKSESESYFKWWEQQVASVNNEDLKLASAERRRQIRNDFAAIDASYQELRARFTPFMNDLRDLQVVLGTGLTPAMVASVQPTITRAGQEGAAVQAALNRLADQYRALGLSLSVN